MRDNTALTERDKTSADANIITIASNVSLFLPVSCFIEAIVGIHGTYKVKSINREKA